MFYYTTAHSLVCVCTAVLGLAGIMNAVMVDVDRFPPLFDAGLVSDAFSVV